MEMMWPVVEGWMLSEFDIENWWEIYGRSWQ
jgi:hypothetical protein